MIQALLGTAPNSQRWAPADLLDCFFRYTEATDTAEDLVRSLNSLGKPGSSTAQEPIEETPGAGPDLVRIFPRMRSLHNTRRDWLSDEELWLAIPEGDTQRQCFTHAHSCPRHSWKLMVEFFLALNTNIGSWIQNMERLLGSMADRMFGFTGSYARQKQASLAPILTGWKRWVEFYSTIDNKMPRTDLILNLGFRAPYQLTKWRKQCRGTWDPTDTRGVRMKYTKYLNKDPSLFASRMYEFQRVGKTL